MATLSNSGLNQGIVVTTKRAGLLDQYFYFFMSLLIPAVVVYGFSFTVGKNLIHPAIPRPKILYVHAAVFFRMADVLHAAVRTGAIKQRALASPGWLVWSGAGCGDSSARRRYLHHYGTL